MEGETNWQPIALAGNNSDMWDDTELIKAYNKAIRYYKKAHDLPQEEGGEEESPHLSEEPQKEETTTATPSPKKTTQVSKQRNSKRKTVSEENFVEANTTSPTQENNNFVQSLHIPSTQPQQEPSTSQPSASKPIVAEAKKKLPQRKNQKQGDQTVSASSGEKEYPQPFPSSSSTYYSPSSSHAYPPPSAHIPPPTHHPYPYPYAGPHHAPAPPPMGVGPSHNYGSTYNPYFPPPPTLPHIRPARTADDEILNNLLMAWYYSGYYAGRYQAMREHSQHGHK
jgi:survival motor neuron protein